MVLYQLFWNKVLLWWDFVSDPIAEANCNGPDMDIGPLYKTQPNTLKAQPNPRLKLGVLSTDPTQLNPTQHRTDGCQKK